MSGYRFDRLKMLIVDDNQHMRTLVSAILQAFGVKTIYDAATAEDAWDLLRLHPCDVIFVDWELPGMSGIDFTSRIRSASDSPNPFIPIVMLTAHTQIERVRAARDAGVNEFLAKPVSAKAILSRLVSIIDHPRPFVRTKGYFGPCRRRRRDDPTYHGAERRAADMVTLENDNESAASAA